MHTCWFLLAVVLPTDSLPSVLYGYNTCSLSVAAPNSAGLTKVSLRDYSIGCLGIVPGTVAFVFIGASTAGTMNEEVR